MKKFNIRSFIMGIVIGALVCSSVAVAFAANYTATLKAVYRDIKVYVNGDQIDYYASNGAYAEPFIINGTTYVPLRLFSEKTGNTVKWDGSSSSIFVLDKEHAHDMDLTPEMALGLVYNFGVDNKYPPEGGYTFDLDRDSGAVVAESDKGFVISFRLDMIKAGQVEDHWNNYYYISKDTTDISFLLEATYWDSRWFDMEKEDLTDYYWDNFN